FCALGPIAEAFVTGPAGAGNTRLGPGPAELNTLAAAHASSPLPTPWPGRSRSAGGEPPTSGPSSPPARAHPSPPPPGRPGTRAAPRPDPTLSGLRPAREHARVVVSREHPTRGHPHQSSVWLPSRALTGPPCLGRATGVGQPFARWKTGRRWPFDTPLDPGRRPIAPPAPAHRARLGETR
ncbi:MAG: hypothetical protein JWQ60_4202, partial [Pseudonocardia sp.]|nr:hypothetical protein [Pseudonocardia sp.]